jgi:hypothetical protein
MLRHITLLLSLFYCSITKLGLFISASLVLFCLLLLYVFITTLLLPNYYQNTTIDCFIITWPPSRFITSRQFIITLITTITTDFITTLLRITLFLPLCYFLTWSCRRPCITLPSQDVGRASARDWNCTKLELCWYLGRGTSSTEIQTVHGALMKWEPKSGRRSRSSSFFLVMRPGLSLSRPHQAVELKQPIRLDWCPVYIRTVSFHTETDYMGSLEQRLEMVLLRIPAPCTCKWYCRWTICEHPGLVASVSRPEYKSPDKFVVLYARRPVWRS